jgi:hypothetical protein
MATEKRNHDTACCHCDIVPAYGGILRGGEGELCDDVLENAVREGREELVVGQESVFV